MLEDDGGDALGDRLDQVDRVALDRGDDLLGELAVVDGVSEVVGGGGGGEVSPDRDVDDELLAVGLLEVEDAVVRRWRADRSG